ncbi:hypothetical protein SNE40_007634 [Patella caerulea]|uniref:Uncharacterized protein n=1 Tax=Patella caerulea TaxID=87958 RepID=A0AAN8K6D5_PATCE
MKSEVILVAFLVCVYHVTCAPVPSNADTPATSLQGDALPRLEVVEVTDPPTMVQATPAVEKQQFVLPNENSFIKLPIHVEIDLDLLKQGL